MPARSKTKRKSRKKGTFVVVGGREDRDNDCLILQEVAKNVQSGHLVVATVASSEPADYFDTYLKVFRKLGIKDIVELYLEDRKESDDEKKLAVLEKASGIFFTGGDQLRISSQMGDTLFESMVRDIYHRGGVVAGTSAGASAMGATMLVRGTSGDSCKVGDLHLAPGLGLIPGVIIDQHFAERGRVGRLLGAIAHNPRFLGIGIDEDTAITTHDGGFTVIGNGAVYVADGSRVTHSNIAEAEDECYLSIFGVKLHVLSPGDSFNLSTRKPAARYPSK